MAINVIVQYNGGLLPDIILLTQCYYHRGTRLNAMKRFCIPMIPPTNRFDIFPLTGGCSDEGLGAFIFFFKSSIYYTVPHRTKESFPENDDLNEGELVICCVFVLIKLHIPRNQALSP